MCLGLFKSIHTMNKTVCSMVFFFGGMGAGVYFAFVAVASQFCEKEKNDSVFWT